MNAPVVTRLAIVLSHPTQYYSPWFRWLRTHTTLEFRVFYLWDSGVAPRRDREFEATFKWDVDLLSGYEHEFVPNVAPDPGTHHFRGLRNPTLTQRLVAWRPSAVLFFGYNSASHLHAIAWARRRGLRLLFRGDSHFLGRGRPALPTRLLLRTLYRQFDAFLSVGEANREYFSVLGVPAERIHFAPHSVNAAHFDPALAANREAAQQLRSTLGLASNTRVLLFAGKLLPAKQPRELLEAFLALRPRDAALVFVGEGPEQSALLTLAREASAAGPIAVHFLPFANQTEMPARYLLADVFALPSHGHYETWGLAVNEAMHMGTPALVSDRVGCQRDLVIDNETGWVFPSGSPEALRDKLAEALAAIKIPERRECIRRSLTERIARYTYPETTAGLLAALDTFQR